jgi:hypothetical protein
MGKVNETGYSATVRLWLQCAGHTLPLAQTSSTFIIAKEPIELPPNTPAQIIATVDDTTYRRDVTLVHGMTRNCPEAMILARDHIPF